MKISAEVLGQGFGILLPLFALGLALLVAAVMCLVGVFMCMFSHSFQNEDGEVRNRKQVIKIMASAGVILAVLAVLTFLGLNHFLLETLQTVSEIELPSDT